MIRLIKNNDIGHSISSFYSSILLMLWIILLLIILFLAWILLSTLEFKIDTRVPVMMIHWKYIGKATILFEDEEWWLQIRVLFFYKKWNLMQMIFADKKKKRRVGQIRRKKSIGKSKWIAKFFKIIKTFQIVQCEMAISTSDNVVNACLYWLNFLPLTRHHVDVNFIDENYLSLVIRNKVWRIAYAFIK